MPEKSELETLIDEIQTCPDRFTRAELYREYENIADTKRYTITLANKLQHEIKTLNDSEEMKAYVKRVIANENQERNILNLNEININEVYNILGESYTCFWGLRENE